MVRNRSYAISRKPQRLHVWIRREIWTGLPTCRGERPRSWMCLHQRMFGTSPPRPTGLRSVVAFLRPFPLSNREERELSPTHMRMRAAENTKGTSRRAWLCGRYVARPTPCAAQSGVLRAARECAALDFLPAGVSTGVKKTHGKPGAMHAWPARAAEKRSCAAAANLELQPWEAPGP